MLMCCAVLCSPMLAWPDLPLLLPCGTGRYDYEDEEPLEERIGRYGRDHLIIRDHLDDDYDDYI